MKRAWTRKRPDELGNAPESVRDLVDKRALGHLVHKLRAPRTLSMSVGVPSWGRWCVKPARGTGSLGVTLCESRFEWDEYDYRTASEGPLMVQELLSGPEYRITIWEDGTRAVVQRLAVRGHEVLWGHASTDLIIAWSNDLREIGRRVESTVVGVDVILHAGEGYVIDVNPSPCLSMCSVFD